MGSIISASNGTDKGTKVRIKNVKLSFSNLEIQRIFLKGKIRIFNNNVESLP